MPKVTVPKDSLEGIQPLPPGIYVVRHDGFKPTLSKNKDSVNLNPQLIIVNHPTLNDRRVFDNLNSKAGWIHQDHVHAFGLTMEMSGDEASIPGDFIGPDDDPSKWNYQGPLRGRTGQVEVAMTDNQKGGQRSAIKRYVCAVPNCKEKHSESLF